MAAPQESQIPESGARKDSDHLSYQAGDVYYKDKVGNVRPGTNHGPPEVRQTPLGNINPVYVEHDELESGTGIMRARSSFVPDNEEPKRNRNGNAYEMSGGLALSNGAPLDNSKKKKKRTKKSSRVRDERYVVFGLSN